MVQMATLVATLNRAKAVDVEKAVWGMAAVLMSGVAVNILPIVSGGIAYYAASRIQNTALKALAITALITGVVLGVLAAI